jgi:hypothetical protein
MITLGASILRQPTMFWHSIRVFGVVTLITRLVLPVFSLKPFGHADS